ncbi:polyprenyl synthetase family protein [Taylorella equigenitalis]|uniref:polyprenyl synthetase family protein n=1 Tax=Taylorella equigenitalis TaxID=29575 RepID=UPI000411861B|nr:farnesyl diphosphate synthase [Taylorella equigenitalis]WDU47457.1 polyprenyl synthetase family protein [Taylorella equigenitalis]
MILVSKTSHFDSWLEEVVKFSNRHLEEIFSSLHDVPPKLLEVMGYATLGPGKRLRAALVLATYEVFQTTSPDSYDDYISRVVCSIELIHAYSLVHDDLPCMDDDDLRRGRPTCHVKFGEAMALLAADALQPLSYEHLLGSHIDSKLLVSSTKELLRATGATGMVGGQVIDILNISNHMDLEALKDMHSRKTGALIQACVEVVSILFKDSSLYYEELKRYSEYIGIAYQVVDDILDATQDSDTLGKTAGKDQQNNKPTYVTILGLDEARNLAKSLYENALKSLESVPNSNRLKELAHYIIMRNF